MQTCEAPLTELSPDEAHCVLEPYFEVVQALYLGAGLELVKRTRFYVAPEIHDTPRHYAACRDDGTAILVAPELAELPDAVVLAILCHEFGHATDFLYPGEFVMGKPEAPAARRSREAFEDKHWARWMRSWSERDDDTVERTADAIAEFVTGVRYGYLGPCNLQSFDSTKARPQGLR